MSWQSEGRLELQGTVIETAIGAIVAGNSEIEVTLPNGTVELTNAKTYALVE